MAGETAYASPVLITIRSSSDGYYHWELHDGPDGAFESTGKARTLAECYQDITEKQLALSAWLVDGCGVLAKAPEAG